MQRSMPTINCASSSCLRLVAHYMSNLVPMSSCCFSFWSLVVCNNGGERPGPLYHVNDVNVYLGRGRGASLIKGTYFTHVLCPEQWEANLSASQTFGTPALGKTSCPFCQSLVYLSWYWCHSHDKMVTFHFYILGMRLYRQWDFTQPQLFSGLSATFGKC